MRFRDYLEAAYHIGAVILIGLALGLALSGIL